MRDVYRPRPIHPADCACPRCDPLLKRSRSHSTLEHALIGLTVAASVVGAVLAVFGAN